MLLAFANNTITATFADFSENNGIIVSRKENSTYKHNDCVLEAPEDPAYTAEVALATYPQGTQRFLNGGGESDAPFTPEPPAAPIALSNLMTGGQSAQIGGGWNNGTTPISGSVQGAVSFSAANVADNGGATIQTSTSYNSFVGGQQIGTCTDGTNNIASRTYNVNTSVWVVPANGEPIMLFNIGED